jgi:hypothetical protein
MTKFSDVPAPSLLIVEGAAPASPPAGDQRIYIDSADHVLKRKNSAGTVTVVGSGAVPVTTKGDLLTYDTAAQRLAVGTNGQVLTADSAEATGLKWGAASGGAITTPDTPPASPSAYDDEFTALSGWTTLGTLDTLDVTTVPGCLYMSQDANAENLDGVYKTMPSMPFTVSAKLAGYYLQAQYASAGIFITDGTKILSFDNDVAATTRYLDARLWANRADWTSSTAGVAYSTAIVSRTVPYMRMVVNSATDIDCYYSWDGYIWIAVPNLSNLNPSMTPTHVGLGVSSPVASATQRAAAWDWIRFT